MKKDSLLFILFLCTVYMTSAQTEISGRVVDAITRKHVDIATITMHTVGSANIFSYTITDNDGTFTIKRTAMPDSVTLSVRGMTIETQLKTVRSNVGFVEFQVKENFTELKEVILQAPIIHQLGDTFYYDVSSFLDETDISIGDVLKKLSGIQLLSSGQIMYQLSWQLQLLYVIITQK